MRDRRDDDNGVFTGIERKRTVATGARWKLLGGLAVVTLAVAIAAWAIPGATVLAVQVAIPALWLGLAGGFLFCAFKAVARLVTGKYRSGRSVFGLPQVGGRRRRRLRSRE